MSELQDDLRSTFENDGYEVDDVTRNRNTVRVVLRTTGADGADLRALAEAAVPADDLLGLNVTTESLDGDDAMSTVVSVRLRP